MTLYMDLENLFGGSLLGESFLLEETCSLADQYKADVPIVDDPVLNTSMFLNDEDDNKLDSNWMSTETDLNLLSEIVDRHNNTCTSVSKNIEGFQNDCVYPASPAISYDSGVSSPGSDIINNSPAHSSSELDSTNFLDELIFDKHESLTFLAESSENQPVLDDQNLIDFCLELPCALELCSSCKDPNSDKKDPEIVLPNLQGCSSPSISSQLLINHSPETNVEVEISSPKPSKASLTIRKRISKFSNEERKRRKRDQNKSAATRYRERKRQEAAEREEEFKVLDSKNKDLKDKVTQTSREINYLKDLMIEVYKLKGLIPQS